MAPLYFTEKQTIPSTWRLLIFGGVTLFVGFVALMIFLSGFETVPENERPYLLTLLLAPLSTAIIFFIRLDVRMTDQSIEYTVYPFRKKYRLIPYNKITLIELMKPKGIQSMQGIGTHKTIRKTEMNFGGKYMMILHLDKGRQISFSTNKPQELKSFLLNLGEEGPKVKIEI